MLRKIPSSQNKPDWMVAYITHNLQDAHIVAGRLEVEGIESLIHTQPGASAMGFTLGNMGEIKVLVHPQDFEFAQDILFPDEDDSLPSEINDDLIVGLDEDDE